MGALALRRRRLNWGLNFNNRCCVRPCLSQSAATDDADVHSLARQNPGRAGGWEEVLVSRSGHFHWVSDLGESVWVEHLLLFDTRRTKKSTNVWTGVSRSIGSGQMRTPVGRRPLLSTSGTSSGKAGFPRAAIHHLSERTFDFGCADGQRHFRAH